MYTKVFWAVLLLFPVFLVNGQSNLVKQFYEGNYSNVVHLAERKLNKGDASSDDLFYAAKSCELLFDFTKAIGYYGNILAVEPGSRMAIDGIGNCYNNLGDKNNAFQNYARIMPSDTVDVAYWGKYAGVLMDLDRYADAEKVYARLLQNEPQNLFFMRKEAIAIFNQKNYSRAIQKMEAFLELKPDDNSLRIALATSYQRKDMFPKALEHLQRITEMNPDNAEAWIKVAYIQFMNLRDYEVAVVSYRKVNQLGNYSDPTHLTNLGICEYFTGNQEYAAKLLDSLSTILPSDPFVHFYAGLSYKKLGKINEAVSFLEIAAVLSIPSYTADVYHHLGRGYSAKRMFPEALKAYEKAREYDPLNAYVLYDIAVTYDEYNRNFTLALAYYQQFASECKNNRSSELSYALDRIKRIKEELFFDGK